MTNQELMAEIERIKLENPDAVLPEISFTDNDTLHLDFSGREATFSSEQLLSEMQQGANDAKQ